MKPGARQLPWGVFLLFLLAGSVCAAQQKADLVRVVKSESRLYLVRDDEVFASYDVVFGANPTGHKEREGDERTPEGRYHLTYKNPNSAFHRSIHISYPNADDREHARELGVDPGGDIMIHGQKNDQEWLSRFSRFGNWTDGCVALSNSDMDEVWDAIDPGVPIEIQP